MSTAEYKRFVQNETESFIEFRTLELYHPQFASVYRFVNQKLDQTFTLEAGAPRDPSAPVLFTAAGFRVTEPTEQEESDQPLEVTFENVDSTVQDILDQISGSGYLEQVEVIYRKYYSNDTSEPAISPLYLNASVINYASATEAGFTAEDINLTTKRVGRIYTTEVYPGLLIG